MVYWFTGQPGHGKTKLGEKLKHHLETNGTKPVIQVDGDDLRELFKNKDYSKEGRIKNITFAQGMSKFLNNKGYDVVVSVVSPYRDIREDFKKDMGDDIMEFYVNTTEIRGKEHFHVIDYEPPLSNYINVDTTKDTPRKSLLKIIEHLKP